MYNKSFRGVLLLIMVVLTTAGFSFWSSYVVQPQEQHNPQPILDQQDGGSSPLKGHKTLSMPHGGANQPTHKWKWKNATGENICDMWITMIEEERDAPDIRVVKVRDKAGNLVRHERFEEDGTTPIQDGTDTEITKIKFSHCFQPGDEFTIIITFDERAVDANGIEFQPTDADGVGVAAGPEITPTAGKALLDILTEILRTLGGFIPPRKD